MSGKSRWFRAWPFTGICFVAVALFPMIRSASKYGGFAACLVFLGGLWSIGLLFGLILEKSTRKYWFTVLTATVAMLFSGACALKVGKQYLRQSISSAFSGVVVSLASRYEQSEAQHSADQQAPFWEYVLDHY